MGASNASGALHVIEKRIDDGETLPSLVTELEGIMEEVSKITESLKELALEKAHRLFDLVFFHFQVQCFSIDVQNACGFRFIVANFLKGLDNHLTLLSFLQRFQIIDRL